MKRTHLRSCSSKRAKALKEYAVVRRLYLSSHIRCEALMDGCTKRAIDIHHKAGREGRLLVMAEHFMAACRSCHDQIHGNPKNARQLGFLE